MTIEDYERSGAPGALEDVRAVLNSWHIPNDTRLPQDDLGAWATDDDGWQKHFRVLPRPLAETDVEQLATTRDAVRALINDAAEAFNALLATAAPTISVTREQVTFTTHETSSAALIGLVLNAAVDGSLTRLRTCQDCGWAFYDTSRNNRRRWCAMNPQSDGRGCGAAAKARDYRRRHNTQPDQAGERVGL